MDNTIQSSSQLTSVAYNHIAVGVPDLDKAVRWYHEVLGFNMVVEPSIGKQDFSILV
jgi:catechol 2,3-dioxygenase-like lactoylglutathione lyase family enzyme